MLFKLNRGNRELKVVEHRPWRSALMLACTIAIGLFCLLLGYDLGQNDALAEKVSIQRLSNQVQALTTQIRQFEAEVVDARLNEAVYRQASDVLRDDLTKAQQDSARLQEEITFFKGLMAPNSMERGLQIAELELTALPDSQSFEFQLLLTQVALQRSVISGTVRVEVAGVYADEKSRVDGEREVVLALTELSETQVYPLKYRFRYFQDLIGRMTLPHNFLPEQIVVTATQKGQRALRVVFPWPQAKQQ